jgi:hypothetical protein
MKHLKTLGLAVVVVTALTALAGAGSASATVLCKTNTNPCSEDYPAGSGFSATTEAGFLTVFKWGGMSVNTCTEAKMSGRTTGTGALGSPVLVSLSSFSWGGCTKPVEVIKAGPLEIYYAKNERGAYGTVTMGEFEWKEEACTYGGPNPDIGIITGPVFEGGTTAKLRVDVLYPLISGFPCASAATFAATYVISAPKPLYFAER